MTTQNLESRTRHCRIHGVWARAVLCVAAIVFTQGWAQAASSPTKVGLHETGGVDVPDGETLTLADDVLLGDGGRFHKTGEGTLVMPMSKVNQLVPGWEVRNLGGTLRVTAGSDATATAAPAIIAQKAALWLNMDSVVVTNAPGDATDYVKKWVDVRDMDNPDSPSHVYAFPAWGSNASTFAGIPPVRVTKDGRRALYFNGYGSCQHLKFSADVNRIRNNFVVHGMYECWGGVLGGSGATRGMVPDLWSGSVKQSNLVRHFIRRADLNSAYVAGRFYKDGMLLDPFNQPPSIGFQLLECEFPARPDFNRFIFRSTAATVSGGDTCETDKENYVQGGDYVSEVILFTNVLTEAERLDVERYLMRKWSLPTSVGFANLPPKGIVASATNTVSELYAGMGETLPTLELSGDGTFRKTGSGTLELGPSSDVPFTGTFIWEDGSVFSRGGRPLPVAAGPGDFFDASIYTPYAISVLREAGIDMQAGAMLTRSSSAAVGNVVKTGGDWVRINAVTGAVKRIDVREGVLALESRERGRTYVPDAPVAIAITNADFEMAFIPNTSKAYRGLISENPDNGWRKPSNLNTAFYVAWTNGSSQTYYGDGGTVGRQLPPPSGAHALMLSSGTGAETDIVIPVEGDYELMFYAKGRWGSGTDGTLSGSTGTYNKSDLTCYVKVYFGPDASTLQQISAAWPTSMGFGRYRFRLPHVTPGTYVLRLAGAVTTTQDSMTLIDNIAIHSVGKEPESVAFEVPNGNFESLQWRSTVPRLIGAVTTLNVPTGWTLDIGDSVAPTSITNSCVAVVAPSFTIGGGSVLMSGLWNVYQGAVKLLFTAKGGKATRTFTAPQGTFRLRADMALNAVNWRLNGTGSSLDASAKPKFKATLTLADSSQIDLGEVVPTSNADISMCWPNAFDIPAQQQVTLTISQTADGGCGTIDNLVFVTPAVWAEQANMLSNPGAEDRFTDWNTSAETNVFTKAKAYELAYKSNPANFGYSAFEGNRYFMLRSTATISQTVSVPEAGLYRLKCHVRSRADAKDFVGNNVNVWYAKEGSATTNRLDTLLVPYMGNFLERAWLVRFPEAARYTIGFSGVGVAGDPANSDREAMLDGLSLVRVKGTVDDVPLFEKAPRIKVAQGSRLVLDFPGTLRTGTVTLGGVQYTGLISAETHPEYVGGIGTLDARYGGISLSFK